MALSFSYKDKVNQLFISPSNARLPCIFDNESESVSFFPNDDDEGDVLILFDDPTVPANQNCTETRDRNADNSDEYNDEVLVQE